MRKYVFIGLGSFIGAVLRYLVKSIPISDSLGGFPLNTLIINVAGAFALAFILTAALEIWDISPDIRSGVTIGLLGAFTTFSTLCKETAALITAQAYFSAGLYIVVSVLSGLGAAYIGVALARKLEATIAKKSGIQQTHRD